LTTAIAGNGAPVAAAAFDTLAGSVWAAGAQMLGSISAFDVGDYVVMGLGVILCDGLCLIGLGIAFTLWIVTAVSLGLLVAIGPLALLCLILPQTSRFFSGWLSGIVTAIVAQFLYTALIALLIATVQTLLVHILATNGSTGANANKVADQLHLLFGAGGIFLIAGFVSLAIVPLARLIGGGAAAETAAISRWAHGQLGAGARAAGGAVAGAAAAVTLGLSKNGAAGMRSITPVGKAVG